MTPAQLKKYRAYRGWNRKQLAAHLTSLRYKVSPRTIEGWEQGRHAMPAFLELALPRKNIP